MSEKITKNPGIYKTFGLSCAITQKTLLILLQYKITTESSFGALISGQPQMGQTFLYLTAII